MQDKAEFALAGKRVWVAGHQGMVGSALRRRLVAEDCDILIADRTSVDLRRQSDVENWMNKMLPDVVFVAAAKVGGIYANDTYPGDFLYDNLAIELNVIDAARQVDVEKLLFLGSSCVYPKHSPQPMVEDVLLSGALEPTNEAYAIAKIAGIKLCQAYRKQYGCDFISAMPANLYGPGDNFDLETSHVLPALIRKAHEAKKRGDESFVVWGSGAPRREFLYVEDLADACVQLMKVYSGDQHINVGYGRDMTVRQLAETVCEIVGYNGQISFDSSKPDGTPQKLLDISKLKRLGWTPKTELRAGVALSYRWYLDNASGG